MKDDEGRVVIPGFYEGIDRTPEFKAVLAAVPDDEVAMRARLGIKQNEKVGDNYQEAMNAPTLNIMSMKSGEPESRRSVIPAFATANFGIRTVLGTPAKREIALVRKWVEGQGYHLVNGTPTDDERRTYSRLAAVTGDSDGNALMTPLDAPRALLENLDRPGNLRARS